MQRHSHANEATIEPTFDRFFSCLVDPPDPLSFDDFAYKSSFLLQPSQGICMRPYRTFKREKKE